MTAGSTLHSYGFEDIGRLLAFLLAVWCAGRFSTVCLRMPALLSEILLGSVLGPSTLAFVPESSALRLLGEVGLILCVIEAGLSIDLELLKKNGMTGLLMGAVGCFSSLLIGFGLARGCGYSLKTSLAIGACFAPTSFGVAVTVLKQSTSAVLKSPIGQLVIVAAIADDVIALVVLSEISVLSNSNALPLDYATPVISAVCFTLFLSWTAVSVMPRLSLLLVKRVPTEHFDSVLLGLILLISFGLCAVLHYGSCSHLFGAFLGGLSFCSFPEAQRVWRNQVGGRLSKWLMRLFFACTIGFLFPIAKVWTSEVFSLGFILIFSLVGKIILGFFSYSLGGTFSMHNFLLSGLSMCFWGDFSLYLAATSYSQGLLEEKEYLSIMLVVLVAIALVSGALQSLVLDRGTNEGQDHVQLQVQDNGHDT